MLNTFFIYFLFVFAFPSEILALVDGIFWNSKWNKVFDLIWFELDSKIISIDLFSLYVLFSQHRSSDNILGNRFFQISSIHVRNHANIRMIYENIIGQVLLGPLLGKQNIQAKQVYCVWYCFVFFSFSVRYNTVCFNFLLLISLIRGNR